MVEFLIDWTNTLPIAAPIGITGSAPLDARTVATNLFETKENSDELNIPIKYASNFYEGLTVYNKTDKQLYLFTGKQNGIITRNCFVAITQGTTLIKDPVDGEYTKGLLYLAPQDYVASEIQQGDAVWCTQSGDASTATFVKAGFNVSLPENVAEYGSEKKLELVQGNNGYEPSVENVVEIGSAGKIQAKGSIYILKVEYRDANSLRDEELIVNGSEFLIPDTDPENTTLTVYYSDLAEEKIALIDKSGKVIPSTKTIEDLVNAALTGNSVEEPEDPDAKIPTVVIYPRNEQDQDVDTDLVWNIGVGFDKIFPLNREKVEISDKIFVRLSTNINEVSTVYLSKALIYRESFYTGVLKQDNKTYIIELTIDIPSGEVTLTVDDRLADNNNIPRSSFRYVPDGTIVGGDSFIDIVANGQIQRMKFTVN